MCYSELSEIKGVQMEEQTENHYGNITFSQLAHFIVSLCGKDALLVAKKCLFKLLNLLNNNKNLDFSKGLPKEWYIKEDKIFFLENVCGKEEVSGFALGNLHKFIKAQKWISHKSD